MSYPILQISADWREDTEQLGSKSKFWFRRDNSNEFWLFKEARLSDGVVVGEDWAEKIAAEIAALLDIPAATVELAEFQGKRGSASLNFVNRSAGEALLHGNEILFAWTHGAYEKTKIQKQSDHTLKNIFVAVSKTFLERAPEMLTQLASYVVLDALIGNTDRHHENWGLLAKVEGELRLEVAPSFDHASSLGRELHDERRTKIMAENRILQYVRHARGGVYLSSTDRRGTNPLALAEHGAKVYGALFEPVLAKLRLITPEQLAQIVENTPISHMSATTKQFTILFLNSTLSELQKL